MDEYYDKAIGKSKKRNYNSIRKKILMILDSNLEMV